MVKIVNVNIHQVGKCMKKNLQKLKIFLDKKRKIVYTYSRTRRELIKIIGGIEMKITIEAKGEKFIVDYYFKEMTESEIIELKELIEECNWDNFDNIDRLYFASVSQTAIYDFTINKRPEAIYFIQCNENN